MSASVFAMSRPIFGALPPDVDVVVIGASMASLPLRKGYGRVDCARPFRKRNRICVREFTEHQSFGVPNHSFDHGCFVLAGFAGKIWTVVSTMGK